MPVTYELAPESRLVRTRCAGDVRFDEVLAHFRELESDPALPPRLDVLLDLRETRSLPESDQLKVVAGEVDRLRGQVRWGACAIVADRDAMFGMSRVFQVFVETYFEASQVFRDIAEAERWLASARRPAPRAAEE